MKLLLFSMSRSSSTALFTNSNSVLFLETGVSMDIQGALCDWSVPPPTMRLVWLPPISCLVWAPQVDILLQSELTVVQIMFWLLSYSLLLFNHQQPMCTARHRAISALKIGGFLRRSHSQWWIDLFQTFIDAGDFHPGNVCETDLLRFCFMHVLQSNLDDVRRQWNTHRIRPSTNARCPAGVPESLYSFPIHPAVECLQRVPTALPPEVEVRLESKTNNLSGWHFWGIPTLLMCYQQLACTWKCCWGYITVSQAVTLCTAVNVDFDCHHTLIGICFHLDGF